MSKFVEDSEDDRDNCPEPVTLGIKSESKSSSGGLVFIISSSEDGSFCCKADSAEAVVETESIVDVRC